MHVETSTLTHLRMAQQLIGRIGSDPSVRMGNQISDVIATNGESWARVKRMVDWYEENYNRPPLDPRVLAEIAVSFKAYDCIHANARAFVEVVAQGIDVPVFLVRSGTHSYVLIGNVETPGAREEDIVVLDLWPRFPMAHTLRDARHKFPLRGEHESAGAYANRLERLDWTISGWRPGQTDFLDGYDFSGTSVKNHDGVLYNGQETPKGTPGDEFDDGLGTYAARHDRDDGLFDEIFDESGGRSSIDNKRSLAQFDPQQYLTSRLGQDPLGAILPQVGNEWLFSTEQPGRLYVADSQIEPLSFNEFSQRDWEAWQDAIVQLRLKDSKSGVVRMIVEDYYDVPRGAPPRGRSYVGESASDSDQGRGR